MDNLLRTLWICAICGIIIGVVISCGADTARPVTSPPEVLLEETVGSTGWHVMAVKYHGKTYIVNSRGGIIEHKETN